MHLIYVSGPFTAGNGRTVQDNIELAKKAGYRLRKLGLMPIIPHISILDPGPGEAGYKLAMKECLELMRRCDGVFMMENWRESRGARIERWVAMRRFNQPVAYEFGSSTELGWGFSFDPAVRVPGMTSFAHGWKDMEAFIQ